MDFLDLARSRFSVLHYTDREIPGDILEKILQAGLAAPTACNFQPQRILVIRSEVQKQALQEVTRSNLHFDKALLVCYDREACWQRPFDGKRSGEIDASIVTTHMMLEATDLGVGSIWVMHWDPRRMAEAFGLADNLEPVALLILGYAREDAAPRPTHFASKSLSDILL